MLLICLKAWLIRFSIVFQLVYCGTLNSLIRAAVSFPLFIATPTVMPAMIAQL